jgi:hypothetical protein
VGAKTEAVQLSAENDERLPFGTPRPTPRCGDKGEESRGTSLAYVRNPPRTWAHHRDLQSFRSRECPNGLRNHPVVKPSGGTGGRRLGAPCRRAPAAGHLAAGNNDVHWPGLFGAKGTCGVVSRCRSCKRGRIRPAEAAVHRQRRTRTQGAAEPPPVPRGVTWRRPIFTIYPVRRGAMAAPLSPPRQVPFLGPRHQSRSRRPRIRPRVGPGACPNG